MLASGVEASPGMGAARGLAPPFAVGRPLSLSDTGPVMQTEFIGADIGSDFGGTTLAVRPGSSDEEAWAMGVTTAHSAEPGYSNTYVQDVFLHHTRQAGWAVAGAPQMDDRRTAINGGAPLLSLSVARNGEGWAVMSGDASGTGYRFAILHYRPDLDSRWFLDKDASEVFRSAVAQAEAGNRQSGGNAPDQDVGLVRLSVDSPVGGGRTYGFALLGGSRAAYVMRLSNGTWSLDDATCGTQTSGCGSGGACTGSCTRGMLNGLASDIVAAGPDTAWAGGSEYSVNRLDCQQEAAAFSLAGQLRPNPPTECERKAQAQLTQNAGSLVYRRDPAGGWQVIPPTNLPSIAQCGEQATGLALDGAGDLWLAASAVVNPNVPDQQRHTFCEAQENLPASASGTPSQVQAALSTAATVPFVLRFPADGSQSPRVYCDTSTLAAAICPRDSGLLPLSPGIPSEIAAVGSAVFVATGSNSVDGNPATLYRLDPRDGPDFVEKPITLGPISSMAFFTPDEGWVAGPGGLGSFLGHWTVSPRRPEVSRWPSPVGGVLTAVASDPGGSGTVMAGGVGGIWRQDFRTGLWTRVLATGNQTIRSISWPTPGEAWAAGDGLYHFDGHNWTAVDVAGALPGDLQSVAVMPAPLPPGAVRAAQPAHPASPPPSCPAPEGSGGTLADWGAGISGELGEGRLPPNADSEPPAALPACFLGETVVAVSGGGDQDAKGGSDVTSFAITCPCRTILGHTAGQHLWAWGRATYGALGLGSDGTDSPVFYPREVIFGQGGDPLGQPPKWILQVSAGHDHTLALTSDDSGNTSIWAWGNDNLGQLGDGTVQNGNGAHPTPVLVKTPAKEIFTEVRAGVQFSLALAQDGTIWNWGELTPTVAHGVAPVHVPGLYGATALAAGGAHALALACPQGMVTCAAGAQVLWGWGDGSTHELGTGCQALCAPSPISAPGLPSGPITAIDAGSAWSAVIDAGDLWGWGQLPFSGYGQITSPTRIEGPPRGGVVALSLNRTTTASYGNAQFALATASDGSVWGFGANSYGQVGQDRQDTAFVDRPMWRIPGLRADLALAGSGLAAGGSHGLLILPRGTRPTPAVTVGPPAESSGSQTAVRGFAVGDHGAVARFDGRRWIAETPTTGRRLLAVAATGGDFVATGDAGLIMVNNGSGWVRAALPPQVQLISTSCGSNLPRFFAAAGLADGTAVVAGERGAVLERDPGASALDFHISDRPASAPGDIHALSLRRDSRGKLRLLASITSTLGYGYRGAAPDDKCQARASDFTGVLLAGGPDGWQDAQLSAVPVFDSEGQPGNQGNPEFLNMDPVVRDQVEGVSLDASGWSGWAVGERGSVWRVNVNLDDPGTPDYHPDGPERSPMESAADVVPDPGALASFAFLANTGCSQGRCVHQLGRGSRGDVVTLEALRAIRGLAARGDLAFVVGGGDLRRPGDTLPGGVVNSNRHDLEQMDALMGELGVPVYEAPGARDLDPGAQTALADSTVWQTVFADRQAPWGNGALPAGFTAVDSPVATGAATHYAFEYAGRAGARIRVVVLDTSSGSLTVTGQNPSNPPQATWLTSGVLSPTTPTVVVMNAPVGLGAGDLTVSQPLAGDPQALAVLASSSAEPNQKLAGGALPFYSFAGGGGALEIPSGVGRQDDGVYLSWQLVSLEPLQGAARLRVRSIPVLDSLSLAAPGAAQSGDGYLDQSGQSIAFTAVGRQLNTGVFNNREIVGNGVPDVPVPPLSLPFKRVCGLPPGTANPGGGPGCRSGAQAGVVPPDYRFVSSDPSVLLAVEEDPANPGHPLKQGGYTIPDATGTSGVFCAYRPGRATVRVEAGTVAAQIPVTVTAGGGDECGPVPPAPLAVPAAVKAPLPVHEPQPPPAGAKQLRPQLRPYNLAAGVVPPPAEVVPAPPSGSGAEKREEEHEIATEDANMTALDPRRNDGIPPLLAYGAAGLGMGLAGALIGLGRRRARPSPAAAVAAVRLS